MDSKARAVLLGFWVALDGTGLALADETSEQSLSEFVLEELPVTTQRRLTDVQTTPAAVSVLYRSDLEARSAQTIEDLSSLSSSVFISSFQGEEQIYIRGIGYSSVIGGSDSSTAFHSDGVYISRTAAATAPLMDIERIEVLRGPQGTLYGRNATGGSVNVITRGPGDHFEYQSRLTTGNYDRLGLFGVASGPISERVKVRFAAQKDTHSGYTTLTRPTGDVDVEDRDDWQARLTVEAKASDSLKLTLKADHYEASDAGVVWHLINNGTLTNPLFQAVVPVDVRSQPYSRRFDSDVEHFNRARFSGISGKAEWELGGGYSLTSLTSYRETRPYNLDDIDVSPAGGSDQMRMEEQHQLSHEFQLNSPTAGRLDWILGAYYFTEDNVIRNEYFLPWTNTLFGLPNDDPTCCLFLLNGRTSTDAYALFGESTFDATSRLAVVLGGRYSRERRDGANLLLYRDAPVSIFDNIAEFDAATFSSFTPKVGASFKLNQDTFLYASASRGFKSGGFNPGSYQNEPFNPEKIWAYELGAKYMGWNDRVRLNTALFFYDYTDLQMQDVENNNVVIRNAAKADVHGLEVESNWLLTHSLRLEASATWLDATFTEGAFLDPKFPELGIQSLDGKKLPRAPEWKSVVGAQFEHGPITLRASYTWQDKIFFSAFNVSQQSQDAYGWLRARATYTSPSRRWSIAAYGDNLTDETVATGMIFSGSIIGSMAVGNLAPPRTFGVEVALHP
jgi:iron complex outermembrane receptor protein